MYNCLSFVYSFIKDRPFVPALKDRPVVSALWPVVPEDKLKDRPVVSALWPVVPEDKLNPGQITPILDQIYL
jgi:hypothetical protein